MSLLEAQDKHESVASGLAQHGCSNWLFATCNSCHTKCLIPGLGRCIIETAFLACRPTDEASAGVTGADPACFPPLPRPMQPRHGIKVQTGGSSSGGAATIRLNDLRATSSQAPNPTLQLSLPRDQEPPASPQHLAVLAEAVQDGAPVKPAAEADE